MQFIFKGLNAWRAYAAVGPGFITLILAISALQQHGGCNVNHGSGMHTEQC